jgi:hypothetical protein
MKVRKCQRKRINESSSNLSNNLNLETISKTSQQDGFFLFNQIQIIIFQIIITQFINQLQAQRTYNKCNQPQQQQLPTTIYDQLTPQNLQPSQPTISNGPYFSQN